MSVGPQRNVLKDLKDAFNAKDPEFHFGKEDKIKQIYLKCQTELTCNGKVKVVTNLDFEVRGARR